MLNVENFIRMSDVDFVIRKMRKRDIPQVQKVAQLSWYSTYTGIIPMRIQKNFLKKVYSRKALKTRLKETIVYVAEIDEAIVGFANYSDVSVAGQTELGALYLHPDYQGQGIGTALLRLAFSELNAKEIHLTVEKNNEQGRKFYAAKGFQIVTEYENMLENHVLEIIHLMLSEETGKHL